MLLCVAVLTPVYCWYNDFRHMCNDCKQTKLLANTATAPVASTGVFSVYNWVGAAAMHCYQVKQEPLQRALAQTLWKESKTDRKVSFLHVFRRIVKMPEKGRRSTTGFINSGMTFNLISYIGIINDLLYMYMDPSVEPISDMTSAQWGLNLLRSLPFMAPLFITEIFLCIILVSSSFVSVTF